MTKITASRFHAIYRELIEENPLAVQAVLKVLAVEFTTTVSTLAVTRDARPRLLVNLAFVSGHCRTDVEVKALVCHEFLHVLLRHTVTPGIGGTRLSWRGQPLRKERVMRASVAATAAGSGWSA